MSESVILILSLSITDKLTLTYAEVKKKGGGLSGKSKLRMENIYHAKEEFVFLFPAALFDMGKKAILYN